MNDYFLLRQYEPVVRYTQGEMFFPCAVDAYLAQCSLWRSAEKPERSKTSINSGNSQNDKACGSEKLS